MSKILKRLKNTQNKSTAVLRPAGRVHAQSSARSASSGGGKTVRIVLGFCILCSLGVLVYQLTHKPTPVPMQEPAVVTIGEIQNQQNQAAINWYLSGDTAKAIEILEKLVTVQPKSAEFQINLAMAYFKAEKFEKAETAIKKAVELEPANAVALNNQGIIALRTRQQALAEKSLLSAVEINPNSSELLFNLASFYEKIGQLKQSIETYQKFISHNSANSATVEIVKRRLPRLNSLYAHEGEDE